VLLIPRLGVRGALIATSVAEAVSACSGAYALVRAEIANCLALTVVSSLVPLLMTIGRASPRLIALLSFVGAGFVVAADSYGARSALRELLRPREAARGSPLG
jgi:hypothetical protein